VQITQRSQLITYNESSDSLINSLAGYANVDKIITFLSNGQSSIWRSGAGLNGFYSLVSAEGYLIISKSSVTLPYELYPSDDDIPDSVIIDQKFQIATYCGPDFDLVNNQFTTAPPTTTPAPTTAPPTTTAAPSSWSQVGSTISRANTSFAVSVDMTESYGNRRIIVGERYYSASAGGDNGRVRIYKINSDSVDELKTFDGGQSQFIGENVAISEDGSSAVWAMGGNESFRNLTIVENLFNSSESTTIVNNVVDQSSTNIMLDNGINLPGKRLSYRNGRVIFGDPRDNSTRGSVKLLSKSQGQWGSTSVDPPNADASANRSPSDVFGANVSQMTGGFIVSAPNADFLTNSTNFEGFDAGAAYAYDYNLSTVRIIDDDNELNDNFGKINDSKGEFAVLGGNTEIRCYRDLRGAAASSQLQTYHRVREIITLNSIRSLDSDILGSDSISFADACISSTGETLGVLVFNSSQRRLTGYIYKASGGSRNPYDNSATWTFDRKIYDQDQIEYNEPAFNIKCDGSGAYVVISAGEAAISSPDDKTGYLYVYRDSSFEPEIRIRRKASDGSTSTSYYESANSHIYAKVSKVTNDTTLTFAGAIATTGGAVTYQWQKRNTSGSWYNIDGANGATLTPDSSYSNNNSLYRVQLTANNCEPTFSDIIRLELNPLYLVGTSITDSLSSANILTGAVQLSLTGADGTRALKRTTNRNLVHANTNATSNNASSPHRILTQAMSLEIDETILHEDYKNIVTKPYLSVPLVDNIDASVECPRRVTNGSQLVDSLEYNYALSVKVDNSSMGDEHFLVQSQISPPRLPFFQLVAGADTGGEGFSKSATERSNSEFYVLTKPSHNNNAGKVAISQMLALQQHRLHGTVGNIPAAVAACNVNTATVYLPGGEPYIGTYNGVQNQGNATTVNKQIKVNNSTQPFNSYGAFPITSEDALGYTVSFNLTSENADFSSDLTAAYENLHSNNAFRQVHTLVSNNSQDVFGKSVAFCNMGKVLAIGAPRVDATASVIKNTYIFESDYNSYGDINFHASTKMQSDDPHFGKYVSCLTVGSRSYVAVAGNSELRIAIKDYSLFGNNAWNTVVSDLNGYGSHRH